MDDRDRVRIDVTPGAVADETVKDAPRVRRPSEHRERTGAFGARAVPT